MPNIDPRIAKTVVLVATVAMIVIRAPHGQRSRSTPVLRSGKGPLEVGLLAIAWVAFFLTLLWIATPWFASMDYQLYPVPFAIGVVGLVAGLWLFYRSHADLGTNWSITLEVREQHQLVTHGVYRWIRHPMYLALLIYAVGQALAVPNWSVGPSYAAAVLLIVVFRFRPEERMMVEQFGEQYEAYRKTTRRLIPGLW